MVEVAGCSDVDVCVARNHGSVAREPGQHRGPPSHPVDPRIHPPVGPLTVTIRHATSPPRSHSNRPAQPLAFEYRDGILRLTIPQVAIHEVVVVEAGPENQP